MENKSEIIKKGTWYTFLGANFLVILGIAITWILLPQADAGRISNTIWMLPTILCNLFSILIASAFIYLETKNINSIHHHINKKSIKFFIASVALYFVLLISSFTFFFISKDPRIITNILYIIDISINMLISLIAMGLYKYASYKMELDVYRRKKGIDPITKEQIPLSKPKNQQKDVDQEVSSGLTKQN